MKYRTDIDGLRALAVVPVILFHAGFELFSGGFVGVDVFFVISGFLITGILIEDIEQERFSIASFYERRARRILPALFFVMICCYPFAWAWMLPSQMKDFSQSLIAVSLFVSNILFWSESGYFDAAAEDKPLLHTWSLAVEEQYYLLFPIFLILAWRFGRNRVFWTIVILAAISLALSEWGWRNRATANFYLAHARAWELFAGSIAAFVVQKRGVQGNNTLAAVGLSAIVFSIFAYNESTPFPSVYALVPVMGVVLILLCAAKDTHVAKLLSTKAFVGVGLISYSAYLWHQPLFAFARIKLLSEPGALLMAALCMCSIILAVFSWKYIEQPFRVRKENPDSRRSLFKFSALGILAFIVVGALGANKDGFYSRLTDQQNELLAYENYPRDVVYRAGRCYLREDEDVEQFDQNCIEGHGALIWGDSHAAAFASGWLDRDEAVTQLAASGCPPLFNTPISSLPRPHCPKINDFVFDQIKQNPDYHVYLHANWSLYGAEKSLKLSDTVDKLKEIGVRQITIIGGVPKYPDNLPSMLLAERRELTVEHSLSVDIADITAIDKSLQEMAQSKGVEFLSALNALCDGTLCKSVVKAGDRYVPTIWDSEHLTREGAVYLYEKLFSEIR